MNLAYVAGIVDGEGNLGFTRIRKRIYPRVFVTNTNLDLLLNIKSKFGGDITVVANMPAAWKQSYHWRISNSAAVDFVERIYPWLRLKANQAVLFFAWDTIRPGSGGRWTEDGLETCKLLDAQRKWLNFKGTGERGPEPMKLALENV